MKIKPLLLIFLLSIPAVLALNETANNTQVNYTSTNQTWYDSYVQKVLEGDSFTIILAIVGLLFVYVFGKIAFKFIKWAVILLVIYLIFKVIF
ncbi:Uncharacterised protein [Candidatus Tiddalikarchaeum anstoanum]|nr:Uncharacterised protein [Candidatus Tiddalikarchaeum anstoanum]